MKKKLFNKLVKSVKEGGKILKKYCRHKWKIVYDSDGDWKFCEKCRKAKAL